MTEVLNSISTAYERTALRRLGMETVGNNSIDQGLADFFNYFTGATQVFPPLWDLGPARSQEIYADPYFQHRRYDYGLHVIGVYDRHFLDQWYLLTVYDARVVVELFSTPKASLAEMVRYLIRNGIRFSTGKPVVNLPTPLPMPGGNGQSFLQKSHQFTITDFEDYQRRKAALLSGAAGRAAITCGGILWRLSIAHVAEKRITAGPSSSVISSGKVVANLLSRYLVDDALTTDEEDIICGVYKVYTSAYSNCRVSESY
jgi:hypothetical protein